MTAAVNRPRRARLMLIVTSTLFSLWIGAMLAMYFKTVYPQRHPAKAVWPVAPDAKQ